MARPNSLFFLLAQRDTRNNTQLANPKNKHSGKVVFQLFPVDLFQGRQALGVASFSPLTRVLLLSFTFWKPLKGHQLNTSLLAGKARKTMITGHSPLEGHPVVRGSHFFPSHGSLRESSPSPDEHHPLSQSRMAARPGR